MREIVIWGNNVAQIIVGQNVGVAQYGVSLCRCFSRQRARFVLKSIFEGCEFGQRIQCSGRSPPDARSTCRKWLVCFQVRDYATGVCWSKWFGEAGALCQQVHERCPLFGCLWCTCPKLSGTNRTLALLQSQRKVLTLLVSACSKL